MNINLWVQVCAEYARIRLGFGGELLCALSGVTSNAYRVSALLLGFGRGVFRLIALASQL